MEMTAQWDKMPNEKAIAVFIPYKEKVDRTMDSIIGKSALNMTAKRPESLLSNLIADILRESATPYLGQPADIGIINIGGIRNTLNAGDITYRTIYEISPFENSLSILTLKGKDVRKLMTDIVKVGGEGLSNVFITATKERHITDIHIGKEPLNDEQLYTIATIDFLAEGNDKMTVLQKAEKRNDYKEATIRALLLEYIKGQTAKGKEVTSRIEGRITIK